MVPFPVTLNETYDLRPAVVHFLTTKDRRSLEPDSAVYTQRDITETVVSISSFTDCSS